MPKSPKSSSQTTKPHPNPVSPRSVRSEVPDPERQIVRRQATLAVLAILALVPFLASVFLSMGDVELPVLNISTPRASLVFSEYLLHYGEQPIQTARMLRPRFEFQNVGDSEVVIDQLVPSCGCIRPQITSERIQPGERGLITLPIVTDREPAGLHEYTLTVIYKDPTLRVATLAVKVVLPQQKVTITPQSLMVMGSTDRPQTHHVTVTDMRPNPLNVTGVTTTSPLLKPAIAQVTPLDGGVETKLAVEIPGVLPTGLHQAIIQVDTDDSEYPSMFVPVLLRGREAEPGRQVTVAPQSTRLIVGSQTGNSAEVTVKFPADWSINHVQTFPTEINADYAASETDTAGMQTMKIKLTLPLTPSLRTKDGVVTLHANDSRQFITVPIQLVWRE